MRLGNGDLRPTRDVSVADWLMERLWRWHHENHPPVRVGSFAPTGFEEYARIFHPIWVNSEGAWTSWAEMAERNGRSIHPEISLWEVLRPRDAGPQWSVDDLGGTGASDGSLPEAECGKLARILARFTTTAELCWFAVWEGWGDLPPEMDALPKAQAPFGRRYILYSGPLAAILLLRWSRYFQSPSLWWPDDRAWFVSTEIDDCSTFVAGSAPCIEAVVGEPALEAMRTSVEARRDSGPFPPRDG